VGGKNEVKEGGRVGGRAGGQEGGREGGREERQRGWDGEREEDRERLRKTQCQSAQESKRMNGKERARE